MSWEAVVPIESLVPKSFSPLRRHGVAVIVAPVLGRALPMVRWSIKRVNPPLAHCELLGKLPGSDV